MDLFSRVESAKPDETLIQIFPAIGRKITGVAAVIGLGILLIWLGFDAEGGMLGRVGLIAFGVAAIYCGQRLWTSSSIILELTPLEFREFNGRVICLVEDVIQVDKGMAVLKPSNGFLLKTRSSKRTTFAPGIWWRIGNRIGVGGLTNAGQGKALAEVLQLLINRREDGSDA